MHVKIKLNNGRRACMKIPIQPQTQRALRPHHWPGTGKIWRTSLAWCSIPLVVVPLVVVPLFFLFKNITLLYYHYHFYDISFVNRNGAHVNSYVSFWGSSKDEINFAPFLFCCTAQLRSPNQQISLISHQRNHWYQISLEQCFFGRQRCEHA